MKKVRHYLLLFLIVSDHSAKELYGGLLVGVISMLIASWLG